MNVFYAIAGVLMILLSMAHAAWGEKRVFNQLDALRPDSELRVSLYIPWHQITFVLLASGVALALSAWLVELALLPFFVLVIVIGNFATFIGICVVRKQTALFSQAMPQMILFSALIGLIILGILN